MNDSASDHTTEPGGPGVRVNTRPPPPGKSLDFVVIGAQRAATTSIWMYLRTHPQLYLPPNKEISFFAHSRRFEQGLAWYLEEYFSLAPPEALWGTATPHYMMGGDVPVETVVARMHEVVPAVRLIALLRDPIERAVSEYKLTGYRDREPRTVTEAMREQLEPASLERARAAPAKGTTYVVQGEYGRILELYLDRFPREQISLVATSELAARSIRTMRRVFDHLGVDVNHVPDNLDRIYHQGGTDRRVSREAEAELREHLLDHVWSRIPDPLLARDAMWEFNFWFRHWNTVSGDEDSLELEPDVRAAMEAHFRADAERLQAATGFEPPWLERWDRRDEIAIKPRISTPERARPAKRRKPAGRRDKAGTRKRAKSGRKSAGAGRGDGKRRKRVSDRRDPGEKSGE